MLRIKEKKKKTKGSSSLSKQALRRESPSAVREFGDWKARKRSLEMGCREKGEKGKGGGPP